MDSYDSGINIDAYDSDEEQETQREKELLIDYVKSHPYPSYDEMTRRIMTYGAFDIFAEYGEVNHNLLKICYDNITNKEICRNAGKKIYDRGGAQAMVMNYYTLRCYSPLNDSQNPVIKTWGRMVSMYWDGIGAWKD